MSTGRDVSRARALSRQALVTAELPFRRRASIALSARFAPRLGCRTPAIVGTLAPLRLGARGSTLRCFALLFAILLVVCGAAVASAQELRCGERVTASLATDAVDTYSFNLGSTHDVRLGIANPDAAIGLLRLTVTRDDGKILADTCQGFANLRLARGSYELGVQDCIGKDHGRYTLLYTARALPYRPLSIAVSPNGAQAFVSNAASGTISVLDLASFRVAREIHSLSDRLGPRSLVVSENGAVAYVANHAFSAVNRVDLVGGDVLDEIHVVYSFQPTYLAVSRDGQRAYIAGEHPDDDDVRMLDLDTGTFLGTIHTGAHPGNLALSPAEDKLYVTSTTENAVDVVDVASQQVSNRIAVGAKPVDVAFTPDGKRALVVNQDDETLSVVDTAGEQVTSTLALATRTCGGSRYDPVAVAISPLGDVALVANQSCLSASLIDLSGEMPTVAKLIPLRVGFDLSTGAHAVAFAPDGQHAYITKLFSDSVVEVDIANRRASRLLALAESRAPCDIPEAPNDPCEEARPLSPTPEFADIVDTTAASREDSDPVPECSHNNNDRRGRSVWYRFDATQDGILSVDTVGSSYDTVLAAYTGPCGAHVRVPGGCNDNVGLPESRIAFNVEAGTTYRFMISAFDDDAGALALNALFEPAGTPVPTPSPTPTPLACRGDCDGNGKVTMSELRQHIATALGSSPAGACIVLPAPTIDEIVAIVAGTHMGCAR